MKPYRDKSNKHVTQQHFDKEPDPSKLQPNGRRKKAPRYRVERWQKSWWRKHVDGYWSRIALCRTLEEAMHQMHKPARSHQMHKPARSWPYTKTPIDVRIVDTEDADRVVAQERLQP